jgi:hypothetical protein
VITMKRRTVVTGAGGCESWEDKIHDVKYKLFAQFVHEKISIQVGKSALKINTKRILNIIIYCECKRNLEIFYTSHLSTKVTRYCRRCKLCVNIVNNKVEIGENECYITFWNGSGYGGG